MQTAKEQTEVSTSQIRSALERVVSSTAFHRSPQLQRLLSFLIEESLAGRGERLKEYVLGVEVFARPPSYDPRLDALVRVEAKRLRSVLDEYYSAEGSGDLIRIELPKGSYRPIFHFQPACRSSAATSQLEKPNRTWQWLSLGITALLLTAVIVYTGIRLRTPRPSEIHTVAVLPLENLSSDPENEYFCFGLVDELTTLLAKSGHLRVIARTSASQFKRGDDISSIAQKLKVEAVLEGSVSKIKGHVRVTMQLINAADSVHLWAETYERDDTDSLRVQAEISKAVALAVSHYLTPNELSISEHHRYSADPEANRLYWKGEYFHSPIGKKAWKENLDKSAEFLEQAVQKDPQFATAYSALADVNATLAYESGGGPATAMHMSRARQAAMRALELDNTMSEAYGVLGTVQFSWDYDHAAAEKSFQRALELNPSDARAHMWYTVALAPQHRFEESLRQARLARDLDPLSFATSNHLAAMTYFTKHYDEAMQLARETIEIDARIGAPHAILGMGYEAKQKFDEAIAEYQLGLRLAPNHGFMTGRLGHALAMAKRTDEVQLLLLRIKPQLETESFSDLYTAYIYLGLRDWDSVFQHLDRAYERHDPDLPFINVDPIFDPVRSDPRFAALLQKLRLAS